MTINRASNRDYLNSFLISGPHLVSGRDILEENLIISCSDPNSYHILIVSWFDQDF